MDPIDLLRELHRPADTKIVLLILDGLGGLPAEPGGATALEAAKTPNLDQLAREGTTGQTIPIQPGITPGSGPAHLALFGYDPVRYDVGRGVLEAAGVGLEVSSDDVAARGNFCTLDESGLITDRRAGRIASELAAPLTRRLESIEIPEYTFSIRHVREYRFALVAHGDGLHPELTDTDPQQVGLPPHKVSADDAQASPTADLFNQWIEAAFRELDGEAQANGLTLRGFSTNPELPKFKDIYGLDAVCVAVYPMYKGVSQLVGMKVIDFEGEAPEDEFAALASQWQEYDFAFVHIKATDSRGEDGDFEGKVAVIEEVDQQIERVLELQPDVVAVTGDHSTPARMRSHSWHPVPLLLWAPHMVRPDSSEAFGERVCAQGGLSTFKAKKLMGLLLGHAGRLDKYGA